MVRFNQYSFEKFFDSLTDEFFATVLNGFRIAGRVMYEPYIYIMGYSGKACVTIYWFNDDPKSIYIADLNVDSSLRNNGIATRLLDICEKIGRKFGAKKVYLLVDSEDWVHDWYERKGYVDYLDFLEDENDRFDTGDDIQIWMKKSLK